MERGLRGFLLKLALFKPSLRVWWWKRVLEGIPFKLPLFFVYHNRSFYDDPSTAHTSESR
jgi:hypothetical protein